MAEVATAAGRTPAPTARRPAGAIPLLVAGTASAALLWFGSVLLERAIIGSGPDEMFGRAEQEVRRNIGRLAGILREQARSVAAERTLVEQGAVAEEPAGRLFAVVESATRSRQTPGLSLTVFSATGSPLAWSGRPSEIPRDRLEGPAALFAAPGPVGLRLVALEPVPGSAAAGGEQPRVGSVAAEYVLSPGFGLDPPGTRTYQLQSRLGLVALRTRFEGAGERASPNTFVIRTETGEPLLEAFVPPDQIDAVRARWRRARFGVVLAALGVTALLLTAPALRWRARSRDALRYVTASVAVLTALAAAGALLRLALSGWDDASIPSPAVAEAARPIGPLGESLRVLLAGLLMLGMVGTGADVVRRVRITVPRWRTSAGATAALAAACVAAGALAGLADIRYQRFLADTVAGTPIDILHFSLHPWESTRLSLMFGLLAFHAALFWGLVLGFAASVAAWRIGQRHRGWRLACAVMAVVPCLGLAASTALPERRLSALLASLVVGAAMLAAGRLHRMESRFRHASEAWRLVVLFLALLVPAVLQFPALLAIAGRAKVQLVEDQLAVQAAGYSSALRDKLRQAQAEIDLIPGLVDLVEANRTPDDPAAETDRAFHIWRQTELARSRLTSAVELYGRAGGLLSRFALNLPEYAPASQTYEGSSCAWEVFGETAPFGSQDRRLLHAERGICRGGLPFGAIVVHVMLDYGALPFIASASPYVEFFRTGRLAPEGTTGGDIELCIYGWGGFPYYASGGAAWRLDDRLFRRLQASRDRFWTRLRRGSTEYEVHFVNNREGIYALGYPVRSWFDRAVRLAELTALAGVLFVALVIAGALFGRVAGGGTGSARELWLEVRRSFYRKLFLAFVAASVVPVLILAGALRAYTASLLRTGVESEAARTAAVAHRQVEDLVALQQRGSDTARVVNDDVMVLISEAIGQDVNVFEGPRLVATSERALFASGLLPVRTPGEVYRSLAIERLSSVVAEDTLGEVTHLVAASTVRLGGRDAILTVPLALRQQEIEREIDELDRGLYLAALVFILIGAGLGFSMAERISDPVRRLTRASRRIARGDLDARVLVRSADELQRLVEAFNRMAVDLKAQRDRLEHTSRLEAWADMARQVAHEIKNPLTPIQLSAEHLRRVNADSGRPLGPVLENCVDSILRQVRLLRQIATEFSSFASSPAVRPSEVAVADLLHEVVDPYRSGLGDRIALALEIEPGLPPLYVDRVLVARALTNVLENAVHAITGPGAVRLHAGLEPAGGYLHVTVADTGAGMDEQSLQRIFEPYFSTKASGTGLGLPIAQRNVELNGGTVEVESAPGAGTKVIIRLPIATGETAGPM